MPQLIFHLNSDKITWKKKLIRPLYNVAQKGPFIRACKRNGKEISVVCELQIKMGHATESVSKYVITAKFNFQNDRNEKYAEKEEV